MADESDVTPIVVEPQGEIAPAKVEVIRPQAPQPPQAPEARRVGSERRKRASGKAHSPQSIAEREAARFETTDEANQPAIVAPIRKGSYSVDQAIALFEGMPAKNMDLVLQVVRQTLQSFQVDLGQVIEEAQVESSGIESGVERLRQEIAEHEALIVAKRKEAQGLQQRHQKLQRVRQHLLQIQGGPQAALIAAPKKLTPIAEAKPIPSPERAIVGAAKPKESGKGLGGALAALGGLIAGLFQGLRKPKVTPIDELPQYRELKAADAEAAAEPPQPPAA